MGVYRGFAWTPWWLLICWLLCYCVQFSAARWFKSHGAHCWMLQPLVYCIVLCAVGLPFVVLHPGILALAPAICGACRDFVPCLGAQGAFAMVGRCVGVGLLPDADADVSMASATPDIPYLSIPGISLFFTRFHGAVRLGAICQDDDSRWGRSYIVAF